MVEGSLLFERKRGGNVIRPNYLSMAMSNRKSLQICKKGGDSSGQWARFLYSPNPTTPKKLPATITPEARKEHEDAKEHLQKVALGSYKAPSF